MMPNAIYGAIILAALCWFFTFGIPWGNFWLKIVIAVALTCLYAFKHQKIRFRITAQSILLGIFSAIVLYGIFYLGHALSPYIINDAHAQVARIYEMGAESPRLPVIFLLLFITGPGEEIFWRGFLQENLMRRFGNLNGCLISALLYAGVHIFSLNFMLIMSALTAGLFWGGLYLWKRDLGMVMISHSLWSAVIFAFFPIR
jgi:hypothetical protein